MQLSFRGLLPLLTFSCFMLCATAYSLPPAVIHSKRSFPPDADYQSLLQPKEEVEHSHEEIQSSHRRPRSFRYQGQSSSAYRRRQPALRMSALIDWPSSEDEMEKINEKGEDYKVSEGPSLATVYAQQEEEDTAQSRLAAMTSSPHLQDETQAEVEEEDESQDDSDEDYIDNEAEEQVNSEDDRRYIQDWSYYNDTESMSAEDYAEPSQPIDPSLTDPTTAILLRLAERHKKRPKRAGSWHADLPECHKDILQAFCEKINSRKELIPNRQNVPRTFRRLNEETIDRVIEAFSTQFGWDLDHALDEIINELMESGRAGDGRGYDLSWTSMHTPKEVKRLRSIGKASGRKRVDNYLRSISHRRRMKALIEGTEEYRKLRTCRPWHRVSERSDDEQKSPQDDPQPAE